MEVMWSMTSSRPATTSGWPGTRPPSWILCWAEGQRDEKPIMRIRSDVHFGVGFYFSLVIFIQLLTFKKKMSKMII